MLSSSALVQALAEPGFQFIPALHTVPFLSPAMTDWEAFAHSWNALDLDLYMADFGRYRRRRHGIFSVRAGVRTRAPHRAHYQDLDYNPLNGGVERWYTPLEERIATSTTLSAVLDWCQDTFTAARPEQKDWDIEVHQFRIEAQAGAAGKPTPEGMHRDGVDYVLVLLVARHNVRSGTTIIGSASGQAFGSFTLAEPLDAMMLDDRRVYHGVTAIEPLNSAQRALRDVLVVTFRAAASLEVARAVL